MADREIASAWLADLRGGKFKYGRGALCSAQGYCPLGILSERIAPDPRVKATGWRWDGIAWVDGKERDAGSIPWDAWKAIGFNTETPSTGFIAKHSDAGDTFETIADYIELALSGVTVEDRSPAGRSGS